MSTWKFDEDEARSQLRTALVDMQVLDETQPLPKPWGKASGVLGKSHVWFILLPASSLSIVAKFDSPARAALEWAAIAKLRDTNMPPLAMLPMHGNNLSHGVVVYRDASGHTLSGHICTLKDLLDAQLQGRIDNCLKALEKTFETLRIFYTTAPGAASLANKQGQVQAWGDFFGAIRTDRVAILAGARKAFDNIDWENDRQISLPELGAQILPNPILAVEDILCDITGRSLRSRVHGDLNLTNILVGMSGNRSPETVFVIDLACCKDDVPTAMDLSRLESEFWHVVFAKQGGNLREVASVLNWLDGRSNPSSAAISELDNVSRKWLHAIRREAQNRLQFSQNDYCLADYMTALYLCHTRALAFPSVQESRAKCQIALVCAGLSLQFINDWKAGKYEIVRDGQLVINHGDSKAQAPRGPVVLEHIGRIVPQLSRTDSGPNSFSSDARQISNTAPFRPVASLPADPTYQGRFRTDPDDHGTEEPPGVSEGTTTPRSPAGEFTKAALEHPQPHPGRVSLLRRWRAWLYQNKNWIFSILGFAVLCGALFCWWCGIQGDCFYCFHKDKRPIVIPDVPITMNPSISDLNVCGDSFHHEKDDRSILNNLSSGECKIQGRIKNIPKNMRLCVIASIYNNGTISSIKPLKVTLTDGGDFWSSETRQLLRDMRYDVSLTLIGSDSYCGSSSVPSGTAYPLWSQSYAVR
jgi:hypothetical protein